MTTNSPATDATHTSTDWQVAYDADPIEIRDPVAEALGVLTSGDPFVVTYTDAVKEAGHSCPTASGAYRIVQLGLDALYPDDYPIRTEIEVQAAGPRDDAAYGVMGRIISYVTGATEDDGFSGLAGGHGGRRDLLHFDAFDPDTAAPTFRFRRTDTNETVEVTYHVGDVPDGGPAIGNLQEILDGSASDQQREAFADAWHHRVQVVLNDDSLFTVEVV
ncbi:hypothetical protein EXE43_02060 [Halorubrum sp. SS5]|uniref:Formylmethanofuran dehydrogenase subunit E domain-containing protein n=1 Tax=Halorubrum salinarum TaxID=2739057 RepID=A0A7D3Y3Q9_9EURY|nr:hypothetical protein [Halorubrum salinarum]QKG94513.1 hypothetical protein HPS36_16690 [Halorubrum salinarum]TKX87677.1 hypothetical protein EXE43_02060 [Halorubrum sp. SS5]